MSSESSPQPFILGQRVHSLSDPRRLGTVMYIGAVEGYTGSWVGVEWDRDGEGKNDGFVNGVRYFQGRSPLSASFVRPQRLNSGIPFLQALELRYKTTSSKEEEDEMYVLSASNKRVSIQLVGKEKIEDKLSRFEELTNASLAFLGVSSLETPADIRNILSCLKELDLTGNLISEWKEVGSLCEQLPGLKALNLSCNVMKQDLSGLQQLGNICVLILNYTGTKWTQVEILEQSLPAIKELHLMGNNIADITPSSSSVVQGFKTLQLLNLDNNCIAHWEEVSKLSQLKSLELLYLNGNKLSYIYYSDHESHNFTHEPFQNLSCLLLGGNKICNRESLDSLNLFPKLTEVRLSDNPLTDPLSGGVTRFVLIARLARVQILNGSEISAREKKESEIRYVRMVMSKQIGNPGEINRLHPRFAELKKFYGIEDEKPSYVGAGPQKLVSGLLAINLKCVGASMGEKPLLTKKLPGSTTVGKLKILCETFFKLKSVKPKLYLQEEGAPIPALLDDEMATLIDVGVGNDSTILIDEEI